MQALEETKDFSSPGRSLTGSFIHPENGKISRKNATWDDPVSVQLELVSEQTGTSILISGRSLFSL